MRARESGADGGVADRTKGGQRVSRRSSAGAKVFSGAVIGASLLLSAILLLHRFIPNRWFNLGSLIETFLPWFGLAVPVLVVLAAIRRRPVAIVCALLPALVWLQLYAGLIPDKHEGEGDFRVVAHNVNAENRDTEATASILTAAEPDVIVLVELTEDQRLSWGQVLAERYPHSVAYGTVALWSAHPIAASNEVDLNLGWARAFRAEVDIDGEPVAFYVAHLLSVRVNSEGFTSEQRNQTAELLGEAIAAEDLDRVVLAGDLNGTVQDRSLAPITYQLDSAHASAGKGFGFTWPADMPMARIDQVLYRGMTATGSDVLEATASDHRPVQADFAF
ncbi:endonuclease/exonuclease/phosphatase family protein [Glycomyces sp. NRRL B-16210]|uniref:endonuclease/exonuclease/phosphatase family protein n=1 Tax=Glycomyces sp. NRRL B-16210 TaxID=1463821 RepID=UPI0004C0E17C|nr:endonuclease/exonuclease/phosphatase family protein [Glycomyces sp. NRRL B-16210]